MSSAIELKSNYTICILGCGTMGTAVLNAIILSLKESNTDNAAPVPGRFLACVNSQGSADRLKALYGDQLEIFLGDNSKAVEQSDVVLLGCKPFMADAILSPLPKGLFDNKIVISLLAGKTIATLTELTSQSSIVARAMTNTPAKLREGMTVVSLPSGVKLDPSVQQSIEWIFNQTGKSLFLDEKYQDVATALCGSGPAFVFTIIESLADGAVKMGMPYPVAIECAAQVVNGAAKMVLESGEHPAVLKSKVCTPAGTTIGGIMVLEENGVRSGVAKAVIESTNIATALGKPNK
ncbi:pyrroline-5-carboxylate reductase [Nadsonia fulvescens var. elongata DSM 6958]|uniref:Pyrroline-5-carboxylate reductase n=1 Tax=Nadsonia fulvescens var. elongata DSM 6958 TaxID=857566 RepID=A0A1E3PKE3_9ASCO|nr:pyrroline-5-carboxylate reductase [Nadsonia fulvescens var. elongata DSM 6958]